jgi:hypothetical protein
MSLPEPPNERTIATENESVQPGSRSGSPVQSEPTDVSRSAELAPIGKNAGAVVVDPDRPAAKFNEELTDADRALLGDRRSPRVDRRHVETRRKAEGRRGRDLVSTKRARYVRWVATVLSFIAVGVAIYAYLHPPIFRAPSIACNEGFGGQEERTQQLSTLWAGVVSLCVAGLLIPDKKKRPLILVLAVGASIGLFLAAKLSVHTDVIGLCLV